MRKLFIVFVICAAFAACKKDSNDIPDDSTFFGRFNGYVVSISTQKPPGAGQASYYASNGSYTSALTNGNFSVSFTKEFLTGSDFQEFFASGDVPYITGPNTNGIALDYVDKNGITWNSERGDQAGSVFTITRSQASGSGVKIVSQFTCNLYDSNGNVIQLTGGTFTGQFRQQ